MVDPEPGRRRGQPAASRHGEEGTDVVPVEIGHGYGDICTTVFAQCRWKGGAWYERDAHPLREAETSCSRPGPPLCLPITSPPPKPRLRISARRPIRKPAGPPGTPTGPCCSCS